MEQKVHRHYLPFLLCANATVREKCKEQDEMRDKRLAVVGAQHAAPGQHTWHLRAHSLRGCSFVVGARYIVPGEHAWRHAVQSRIAIHRPRNARHASPDAIPKLQQVTRHTVPSNFSGNSMKTKDRSPRKVTHFYSPAHPEFPGFRGPLR